MDRSTVTQRVRELALELGFSAVGIARTGRLDDKTFEHWLELGYQGEMNYLDRNRHRRLDPGQVFPSVRSIVSVALDYFHPGETLSGDSSQGVISRYARGKDYHQVIERKLRELFSRIQAEFPETDGRYYVDTGPVLEKVWAARAGLGWIGKHTNLISKERGSWFFLGELLLNLELEADQPVADHCGSCTRCIDICPTQAIVEPYVLDARRCISYLTIELRSDIPSEFRSEMENLIFGCDLCQDVCPWNRKTRNSKVEEFRPKLQSKDLNLKTLAQLTPESFIELFRNTPVTRAKWRGLMRNVAIAMGNTRSEELIEELKRLLEFDDEMVRRHAAWALERIGTPRARTVLETSSAQSGPGQRQV